MELKSLSDLSTSVTHFPESRPAGRLMTFMQKGAKASRTAYVLKAEGNPESRKPMRLVVDDGSGGHQVVRPHFAANRYRDPTANRPVTFKQFVAAQLAADKKGSPTVVLTAKGLEQSRTDGFKPELMKLPPRQKQSQTGFKDNDRLAAQLQPRPVAKVETAVPGRLSDQTLGQRAAALGARHMAAAFRPAIR